MPFNYGTTSTFDDPRTAYVPRNVNGLTSYWNATRGQNMDFQTGNPLSERLAMIQAQQPPSGAGMIYGDSYGGIQGVEESRAARNAQIAMQLAQMRQGAFERQQARNDANQRFNAQLDYRDALLGQQSQFNDAKNRLAAENLGLRREAEMGRNNRASDYAQMRMGIESMKNGVGVNKEFDKVDSYGSSLADQWGSAISNYNALQDELKAMDMGSDSDASAIGQAMASERIKGTPFGYSAVNPNDAAIADLANKFAKARQAYADKEYEIEQTVKEMDKIAKSGAAKGFQIAPQGVIHERSGYGWGVNAQPQRYVKPPKAADVDPEDAYLAKFGRAVQPPSGIAKYGGTYR
jgi:hypothetical protein